MSIRYSKLKLALLTVAALLAGAPFPAVAGTQIGIHAGYGTGALTRNESEAFTAITSQARLGYEYWGVNFHGFFQHMAVTFADKSKTSEGVWGISGVGASIASVNAEATGRISAGLQVPISSVLSVLSESNGTVNGKKYILSELTSLQGGTGTQILIGYERYIEGKAQKKISRSGKAWAGVFVSSLQQQFTSQTVRIKTNNSEMAPISPGKTTESAKATLNALNFAVNFSF